MDYTHISCFLASTQLKNLVIYQDRIHNIDDQTVDLEDLLEWEVAVLRPAAKKAQNPNAEANSGKWCKYCPGKNICRKSNEDVLSIERNHNL